MTAAELRHLAGFAHQDQAVAAVVTAATLILLALAARAAWRALRRYPVDDLLTFAAAGMTGAVVANGMWHFAGERLHFSGLERVLLFAILEVTVLACAVRARRNIRESPEHTAGPEGVAIWLVSIGSGAFAATATTSAPEALFRLLLPLLATWLWERSLLPDRRKTGKDSRWRAFAERVLARLGIGALNLTSDEDSAARWRIAQLARAVVRAKRAARLTRRWRRWRVDVLTAAANEHAELATSPGRQDLLVRYIGALLGSHKLIDLDPPAPWDTEAIRLAWQRSRTGSEDGPGDGSEGGPGDGSEDGPGDGSEDGSEGGPGDGSEDGSGAAQETGRPPRRAALRLRPGHGKTPAQLVPHVLAMIDAYGSVGRDRIKDDLRVGSKTASLALTLALATRDGEATGAEPPTGGTVTPIEAGRR